MYELWYFCSRRKLFFLPALLVLLAACVLFRRPGYVQRVLARSVTATPCTIHLTEKATGKDGRTVVKHFTRAIRSDGTEVTIETGTWTHEQTREPIPYTRRQLILNSGVRVFLYDDFQLKSTAKFAGGNFAQWQLNRADSGTDCLGTFGGRKVLAGDLTARILGREQLNGLRTVKVEMPKQMHPDLKVWYALDYGCELVGQRAVFPDSVDEKFVDRVLPGEPDPALFTIPGNYREVPPSELDRASFLRYGTYASGTKLPAGLAEEWRRSDSRYYQERP